MYVISYTLPFGPTTCYLWKPITIKIFNFILYTHALYTKIPDSILNSLRFFIAEMSAR